MKKLATQVAAVSALALLGTTAQAAIISASAGSEAIISFTNAAGDSISFDSGDTNVQIGDSYVLPAAVLSFINAAGGASNVLMGIIAGNVGTRNYLTSSGNALFAAGPDDGGVQIANAVRNGWASQINQFIQDLNASVPSSPTSQNDTYGPFLTGTGSPNYIDGLFDSWGSGDFQLTSLGSAADPLYLYNVGFGTNNIGFANISQRGGGVWAELNLTTGRVNVVPVPAAVWLFASGLGLLGVARRRAFT
jgi:hypothetical protein